MSDDDRLRWDKKWNDFGSAPEPSPFLQRNVHLLGGGVGLDLACGLGQNTVFLAAHGYRMLGVDISYVALKHALLLARNARVHASTGFVQLDLDHWRPPPASVDLLCVFRFLDRRLIPSLRRAVRVGGSLFYLTRHHGIVDRHPEATTEYLLQDGELQAHFAGWEVLDRLHDAENEGILVRKYGESA